MDCAVLMPKGTDRSLRPFPSTTMTRCSRSTSLTVSFVTSSKSDAAVNHDPQQFFIPSVTKASAIACGKKLLRVHIRHDGYRSLKNRRWLHPLHRVSGNLTSIKKPVEELTEVAIAHLSVLGRHRSSCSTTKDSTCSRLILSTSVGIPTRTRNSRNSSAVSRYDRTVFGLRLRARRLSSQPLRRAGCH